MFATLRRKVVVPRDASGNAIWRLAFIAVCMVSAGACAPTIRTAPIDPADTAAEQKLQREIVLESLVEDQFRLHKIGFRIASAAAGLCGDKVRASYGFFFANEDAWGTGLREAARALYGLDAGLTILDVAPASGAAGAGLQNGDRILAIDGQDLPRELRSVAKFKQHLKEADGRQLALRVDGERIRTVIVRSNPVCDYSVQLANDESINAFADGKRVVVTRAMMRFARDEVELALVLGHELAHNVMNHVNLKLANTVPGLLLDLVFAGLGVNTGGTFSKVSGSAYSQDFEAEADYVGLYYLARAGYPIDDAPKFWRRMAALNPKAVSHATSHPTTATRFVGLRNAVKEITSKLGNGEPLAPNLK